MNSTEDKMIEILKILKKDYGVIAVKSEFETEGSRKDELTKLRDIISKSNLKMYIKIGGCEAIRDLDDCKILGADGIMAPMIETEFAASKFRNAFTKGSGNVGTTGCVSYMFDKKGQNVQKIQ